MLGPVTSMPTPEEWLANFNAKIADVKAKTEAFKQNLEQAGATETSKDGQLSVTVAPNGSLSNLRIDDTAVRGSGAELASKIMQLARKAQRAAAVNVTEAFAPLGAGTESMQMLVGYLPEPEEDEEDDEGPSYSFDEQPAARQDPVPPVTPPAAEQPRRPTRPAKRDEDEDFSDDDLFGR
jgi:DNA-binding protein YbaB